jgi:hypothetical protein
MSDTVQQEFTEWRREREAVQAEMDQLIKSGSSLSEDERKVRRIQFAALIERREAAAHKILPRNAFGRSRYSEALS